MDAYIDKARKDWGVAGLAVAVVKGDSVIYAKGFGVREVGKPEPIDERTLFAIGSNTKSFTVVALGMLQDEGKLTIDDKMIMPRLSHDWLRVTGDASGRASRFAPGLTFGWDIRPNRLQSFVLRTSLRWTPGLSVRVQDGRRVAFDQLEFNFIQFVLYPSRMF